VSVCACVCCVQIAWRTCQAQFAARLVLILVMLKYCLWLKPVTSQHDKTAASCMIICVQQPALFLAASHSVAWPLASLTTSMLCLLRKWACHRASQLPGRLCPPNCLVADSMPPGFACKTPSKPLRALCAQRTCPCFIPTQQRTPSQTSHTRTVGMRPTGECQRGSTKLGWGPSTRQARMGGSNAHAALN